MLTSRGTVRTRKPVPRLCRVYPTGSPAEWISDGHAAASISCVACGTTAATSRSRICLRAGAGRGWPDDAVHGLQDTWRGQHRAELAVAPGSPSALLGAVVVRCNDALNPRPTVAPLARYSPCASVPVAI
ncbi:MAG: hypothetical protein MZV49_07735 [Rhodopseudomonas palustris]|nr:hypothetical protein [Rhodopseudomonas palustris]